MSRLPASGRQHTRKQRLEEEDEPIELQLEEECPPTPMDRSLSNVVDEAAGTDAQVRELKGAAASKTMTRTQAQLNRSFQTSKMVRHLVVFAVLTFMHALALLVFKLCVVDHTYPFSPASALVCTEATKLLMATVLHHREIKSMPEESRPSSIADSFRRTASLKVWLSTATVAALYSANNLLSFFLVAQTDPGTLAIAKATVPYLCAVLLRFLGRPLTDIQWCCIILQCTGVAVTQYRASSAGGASAAARASSNGTANATDGLGADESVAEEGSLNYEAGMYVLLMIAILVTAVSSVFNERIIKKFDAPLQQINMIMYLVGVSLATFCFLAIPRYTGKPFFDGYSPMTILLIIVQSFYGICVGYAYKYADVLIKNLSTSTTLALLVFISYGVFGAPLTFYSVAGVVIIIVTSYLYLRRELN